MLFCRYIQNPVPCFHSKQHMYILRSAKNSYRSEFIDCEVRFSKWMGRMLVKADWVSLEDKFKPQMIIKILYKQFRHTITYLVCSIYNRENSLVSE